MDTTDNQVAVIQSIDPLSDNDEFEYMVSSESDTEK